MGSEDEGKVREGSLASLIEAVRELTVAMHAMAQSNALIAEALLAGSGEIEPVDDGDQQMYLDGTPIR